MVLKKYDWTKFCTPYINFVWADLIIQISVCFQNLIAEYQ